MTSSCNCPILKFVRYRAIYFKPCFILFKARIIHSIMQLLTDWLNDMATLNKCWIRGNNILLHIINKEKIAKKTKNSVWIFIKIQLKKKKKKTTTTTATTKELCLHVNGKTFPEQTPDDHKVGSFHKNWNFSWICYCP